MKKILKIILKETWEAILAISMLMVFTWILVWISNTELARRWDVFAVVCLLVIALFAFFQRRWNR